MAKVIDRITLADVLPRLECPLMISGGGHDHITPGEEAWRIFEDAHCDRELVFYPRGAHDCFNVLADLRPRMVGWVVRHLEEHRARSGARRAPEAGYETVWGAAEAVDPEFADALSGEPLPRQWNRRTDPGMPVQWDWPWHRETNDEIEVVLRRAGLPELRDSRHRRAGVLVPVHPAVGLVQ